MVSTAVHQESSHQSRAVVPFIHRSLEVSWLLTVILVPLAFFEAGYVVSDSGSAFLEIPKVALLRTMAALMSMLWAIEWAIQSNTAIASANGSPSAKVRPSVWLRSQVVKLQDRPSRWLYLAVSFYLGTTLLSTILSGSFHTSMWGDIAGQDGYAAYTVLATSKSGTRLLRRDQGDMAVL